jgi:hypothetical protein
MHLYRNNHPHSLPSKIQLVIARLTQVAAICLSAKTQQKNTPPSPFPFTAPPKKQKTHSACEWVGSFRFVALLTKSPLAQL